VTAAADKPRRRKWPWRVLWGMLAILLGAVGFWNYHYWSALRERDALIAEIRARGEPVWWDELCEKLIRENPPDSGATYFRQAMEKLPPSAKPGRLRAAAHAVDKRIKERFPNPTFEPEIQADLKAVKESFALLEEAVKRPPGLVSEPFLNPEPIHQLFEHLDPCREINRLLRWEVYDALSKGDMPRAYKAVRLGLMSAEQLSREPFDYSRIFYSMMQGSSGVSLLDCLQFAPVSLHDFLLFDELLSPTKRLPATRRNLKGERAFWLSVFDDGSQIAHLYSIPSYTHLTPSERMANRQWIRLVGSPFGRPVLIRTQTEFIRACERMDRDLGFPFDPLAGQRIIEQYRAKAPLVSTLDDHQSYGNGSLRSFDSWYRRPWKLILFRLALRLRRHYDLHRRFPSSLDEVCDESMPRIPVEWFLDQPLVYKRGSDGFILDVPEAAEHRKGVRLKAHDAVVSTYGIDFKLRQPKTGIAK
jgi:hypothetical protein